MKKLLICMLLLTSILAHGQWTTNTLLNTEVKDSVSTEESVPLTATTSDGKTWVSYFAAYGGYQMRLQLLDSTGIRLLGPDGLLVSNNPQSTAIFRYDLKCDEAGNAIVAFQDIRTAGNLNVVVYKIDQQGNFLWGNNGIQLIDPISTQGIAPSIGFTRSGNTIVAWNSSGNNPKWISMQKISPAGLILWNDPVRVIDSVSNKKYSRPTMVPTDADGFTMMYVEETGFGLGVSNMYAKRFDTNGDGVWVAPVHLSSKTTSFFFFCKALSDGNGGFFTAFNTSDSNFPGLNDVYVQHIDSVGNLWNANGNIACNTANINRFCASTRYDVTTATFWVLIKATDSGQSQSGVTIQAFDAGGSTLLTPPGVSLVPISAAYDDPYDLSITNDGVISFYYSGTNPSQTINAMKCDFSGALMWNGFPANICTRIAGKDDLAAGDFKNNQVVVVWTDNRNDFGVYAQNIRNDGTTGNPSGTGISENNNSSPAMYPNPFQNTICIQEPSMRNGFDYSVYDLGGQIIQKGKTKSDKVFIGAEWPAGAYTIKIDTSNQSKFMRLIKTGKTEAE